MTIILVLFQCPLLQKFQRDWKEIVDVLCEAANDIRYRPYPQLVVVEEEEIDRPHFSGSINETEAETPIYSNSDDDSEAFCTPTSPTPTHEVS